MKKSSIPWLICDPKERKGKNYGYYNAPNTNTKSEDLQQHL